jgi:hypothetical protein
MRGEVIARSLRVTGHASIPCREHAAFECDDNKKQSYFDSVGIYSVCLLRARLAALDLGILPGAATQRREFVSPRHTIVSEKMLLV